MCPLPTSKILDSCQKREHGKNVGLYTRRRKEVNDKYSTHMYTHAKNTYLKLLLYSIFTLMTLDYSNSAVYTEIDKLARFSNDVTEMYTYMYMYQV